MSEHNWDENVYEDAYGNGMYIGDPHSADPKAITISCDSSDANGTKMAGFVMETREAADTVIDRLVECRDRIWPQQ